MLKNLTIHHVDYGSGVVVGVKDDTVSIHFRGTAARGVTRKFLIAALFNDDVFPRAKNAELWAVPGLGAHKKPKPEGPAPLMPKPKWDAIDYK